MNPQCAQCGRTANPNAKFCPACGARLAGAVQKNAAQQVQRLQPGQLFHNDHFRILHTLGKGGMGLVYLAENRQAMGRRCVVKEMLDYYDPNDAQQVASARQRFEDEARTLAQLNHPGIPGLVAYFHEGGHNYIAMDYVDGKNLDQLLGKNLPDAEIINCGIQVCEILEYLAEQNPPVVHHDIKPANVIVDTASKRACLVDFGTAKARLAQQPGGGVGLLKSSIYGTQGYAPPEQYQGQSDPRSDVYALAATLYHLATGDDPGQHPFTFPQLNMLAPKLHAALTPCLREMQRRSTAQALHSALQDALKAASRSTSGQRRPAALLQTLGAHESYAVISPHAAPAALRTQVTNLLQAQLSLSALAAEMLAWQTPACYLRSDDGRRAQALVDQLSALKFQANAVRTSQVLSWRASLGPAEQQQLTNTGEVAIHYLRFPQDRVCVCHSCGHRWTTQAQDVAHLRRTCSKCGHDWFAHRIFRCHICGHEFAHADMIGRAAMLFPQCPACHTAVWLPQQQPRLVHPVPKVVERLPAGAIKSCQIVLNALPNGTVIRGRVALAASWLAAVNSIAGGKVDLTINAAGLLPRQTYKADGWVITNAGNAQLVVEIYVEAPALLVASPASLDFGVVKANATGALTLNIRNSGDLELTGKVTSTASWLRVAKNTFRNRESIQCQVAGRDLYQAGVNTASLLLESNGGNQTIPVTATALPTTLAANPSALDLGHCPRRGAIQAMIELENTGLGLLKGEISADAPWITLDRTTFVDNTARLTLAVALRDLEPGAAASSQVNITSNGGSLIIPVLVRVSRHGWLGHLLRYNRVVQVLLILFLVGGSTVGWMQFGGLQQAASTGRHTRAGATSAPVTSKTPTHKSTAQATARTGAGVAQPVTENAADSEHMVALPFVADSDVFAAAATSAASVTASVTATPAVTVEARQDAVSAAIPTATRLAVSKPSVLARPTMSPSATPGSAPATAPGLERGAAAGVACLNIHAVITKPVSGARVSGVISILGTADYPQFGYYKLELAPADTPGRFSYLAGAEEPVTNDVLAQFDTSVLQNGSYVMRLTVVDSSGNYPSPCSIVFVVMN